VLLRVHALVPAAGRSERFGSSKLLAKWHDRELLGHVLHTLRGARAAGLVLDITVVHAPDDEPIRGLAIEYDAYPLETRGAGDLSDSLRTGIDAFRLRESRTESAALLICLGDQPQLRLDVIQALVLTWRSGGAKVVRPSYRDSPGSPGHPLLVDRSFWDLADEMRGDTGLAAVLDSRGAAVQVIPVGGGNPGVDTPEDLEMLDREDDPTLDLSPLDLEDRQAMG
jgi:molybdenum cofactor cytidylyltransferase